MNRFLTNALLDELTLETSSSDNREYEFYNSEKKHSTAYLKKVALTLWLPVTRICVNYSTFYNDMLVAKGLTFLELSIRIHTIIE